MSEMLRAGAIAKFVWPGKAKAAKNQPTNEHCIIGWVEFWLFYIFNKRTPKGCCIPLKSRENEKKVILTQWPSDRFIIGPESLGHSL
jgi:hypothetical protein